MGKIRVMLAVLAILAAGGASGAPAVATLERITGLVRIARATAPDNWLVAAPRMQLFVNDRVKTLEGEADRADIRFTSGALVRLGSRTTFEMRETTTDSRGVAKRIASRLLGGMIRVVIRKLAGDEEFKVYSDHAVAAVKGCDFYFDRSTVLVIDEKDNEKHSVILSDLAGKRVMEILEGMYGSIKDDGSFTNPSAADSRFMDGFLRTILTGGGGGGTGGGAAGGGGAGGAGLISPQELRADLKDFVDSQEMGNLFDNEERLTDISTGKVLVDMNGYRVRAEEYLFQMNATTVEFLALNTREGGPNGGVTMLRNDTEFNQDLPGNYADVLRGLPDAFANPGQPPEYWPISEKFMVANPAGDSVRRESTYGAPQPMFEMHVVASDTTIGWYYTPDPGFWQYNEGGPVTGWGQVTERWLFVGNINGEVPKEHFRWDKYGNIERGWYAGCYGGETNWMPYNTPTAMYDMYPVDRQMDVAFTPEFEGLLPTFGEPLFGTGTRSTYDNALGGVTEMTRYGDGTYLRVSNYLVDDTGKVITSRQMADILAGNLDASVISGGLNFETVYEATEFEPVEGQPARTIDLLLYPISFDGSGSVAADPNRIETGTTNQ